MNKTFEIRKLDLPKITLVISTVLSFIFLIGIVTGILPRVAIYIIVLTAIPLTMHLTNKEIIYINEKGVSYKGVTIPWESLSKLELQALVVPGATPTVVPHLALYTSATLDFDTHFVKSKAELSGYLGEKADIYINMANAPEDESMGELLTSKGMIGGKPLVKTTKQEVYDDVVKQYFVSDSQPLN